MAEKRVVMKRVNTRVFAHQDAYIKERVIKSNGKKTEGDVYREMIEYFIKKH